MKTFHRGGSLFLPYIFIWSPLRTKSYFSFDVTLVLCLFYLAEVADMFENLRYTVAYLRILECSFNFIAFVSNILCIKR